VDIVEKECCFVAVRQDIDSGLEIDSIQQAAQIQVGRTDFIARNTVIFSRLLQRNACTLVPPEAHQDTVGG
jgi:hypothetical protein